MDRNKPEMDQNGLEGIENGPELTGNGSDAVRRSRVLCLIGVTFLRNPF